jgi:hypothetical protein
MHPQLCQNRDNRRWFCDQRITVIRPSGELCHILEDKESRLLSYREISALESQAAALRSQLSVLDSTKSASQPNISQLRRKCDAIRQQTTQLLELTEHFSALVPNDDDDDAPEIPPDVQADVLRKVDEVVGTICQEFAGFDDSEFSDSLAEIHRLQTDINQIASDDWDPTDDLQSSLEEFCARSPIRPTSATLSAVDIPHATQSFEVS